MDMYENSAAGTAEHERHFMVLVARGVWSSANDPAHVVTPASQPVAAAAGSEYVRPVHPKIVRSRCESTAPDATTSALSLSPDTKP